MPDLVEGLVFYVVFVFSTVLHEAAHAWAALKGGDPTAYEGGQVTLDPVPHIRREPIGMVLVPIFLAMERIDSSLPGKYSPMINDHFRLW